MSDIERGAVEMLTRDVQRMRTAGTSLAEAALRVVRDYDGVHRLALAVAEWSTAVANEGDRPHRRVNSTRELVQHAHDWLAHLDGDSVLMRHTVAANLREVINHLACRPSTAVSARLERLADRLMRTDGLRISRAGAAHELAAILKHNAS